MPRKIISRTETEPGRAARMARKELAPVVEAFLQRESMCVLATCSLNIPRASSVEFFPSGTTLYIVTEGGEKVENIARNPRVSIAIHGRFTGWKSVRGVQITGHAELGGKGSQIFEEGTEAFRIRRGLSTAELPDFITVIRVIPLRIEYIDTTLAEKGFDVRQELDFTSPK